MREILSTLNNQPTFAFWLLPSFQELSSPGVSTNKQKTNNTLN